MSKSCRAQLVFQQKGVKSNIGGGKREKVL